MTEKTAQKASDQLIDNARQARHFIECAGESDHITDEMLVRASVAWGMLERIDGLEIKISGVVADLAMPHAIAAIANNYADYPPSTPERAALFSTVLTPPPPDQADLNALRRAFEDSAGYHPTLRDLVAAVRRGAGAGQP